MIAKSKIYKNYFTGDDFHLIVFCDKVYRTAQIVGDTGIYRRGFWKIYRTFQNKMRRIQDKLLN